VAIAKPAQQSSPIAQLLLNGPPPSVSLLPLIIFEEPDRDIRAGAVAKKRER
jgi:hypothetical protein